MATPTLQPFTAPAAFPKFTPPNTSLYGGGPFGGKTGGNNPTGYDANGYNKTHAHLGTLPQTGLNAVLPTTATVGDLLVAVVIGKKNLNPFGQTWATSELSPFNVSDNPQLNTAQATPQPVLNDNEGNTWSLATSSINIDLLATETPAYQTPGTGFLSSNAAAESVPDLDAKFPSVFMFYAPNVAAGTQSLNVRANYLTQNNYVRSVATVPWLQQTASQVGYLVGDPITVVGVNGTYPHQQTYTTYVCIKANPVVTTGSPPVTESQPYTNATYWSTVSNVKTDARFASNAGEQVFSGLDVLLFDFSGVAASTPLESASSAIAATNPVTTAVTTGETGDLLIAVGLQVDGNEFDPVADGSPPEGWTVIAQGKLTGSEQHFVVMYQVTGTAGTYNAGFLNPSTRTVVGYGLGDSQIANQGSTPSDPGATTITSNGPGFSGYAAGYNQQSGTLGGYAKPGTAPVLQGYKIAVLAAAFKHS
jgi:hypothetical protein